MKLTDADKVAEAIVWEGVEDDYVDLNMYPCRICDDYDRKRGCMSKGGCGERKEEDAD